MTKNRVGWHRDAAEGPSFSGVFFLDSKVGTGTLKVSQAAGHGHHLCFVTLALIWLSLAFVLFYLLWLTHK